MLHYDIFLAVVISYLFGSIQTAVIICKIMGYPDPRTQGSGNPGATNVLRMGGKKAAILTLLGDLCKGFIPVMAAQYYGLDSLGLSAVAFAAFLGHIYPLFSHFKGGKGVATALGCLLALAWPVGLALICTWLIMAMLFRYSSLAALTAAVLAPLYIWYFTNIDYTVMVSFMSILLVYRHKNNILRLIKGEEGRI